MTQSRAPMKVAGTQPHEPSPLLPRELHWWGAGVQNWSWGSNPGTQMWASGFLTSISHEANCLHEHTYLVGWLVGWLVVSGIFFFALSFKLQTLPHFTPDRHRPRRKMLTKNHYHRDHCCGAPSWAATCDTGTPYQSAGLSPGCSYSDPAPA